MDGQGPSIVPSSGPPLHPAATTWRAAAGASWATVAELEAPVDASPETAEAAAGAIGGRREVMVTAEGRGDDDWQAAMNAHADTARTFCREAKTAMVHDAVLFNRPSTCMSFTAPSRPIETKGTRPERVVVRRVGNPVGS